MGIDNRQRRAAKAKKRARQRGGRPTGGTGRGPFAFDPGWDARAAYGTADLLVTAAVRRLTKRRCDETELLERAAVLVRRLAPIPLHVLAEVLGGLLAQVVDGVIKGGWGPADLEQLVLRHADEQHVPMMAAVLHDDARRHGRQTRSWRDAVEALGADGRLRLDTVQRIASGLQVAALLAKAPLIEADAVGLAAGRATDTPEHPKLARVRALLAKAESTQYDDEAELLSAKAQELITRYALHRLLDDGPAQARRDVPGVRRIWLDAPYVRAKAALVDEVAGANRCRAAVSESLGFSVVVGSVADLDAVELLVTSLLVQANRAMLRHGRRFDQSGASRTRGFRQAFLLAYAGRIGERLRSATETAAADADAGRLLPVLRDHEARVGEAFQAMVPHTLAKASRIADREGWAAGVVAADLALLDVNGRIDERAG